MKKSLSRILSSMQRKSQGARALDGISINQRRLMRDLNAIGRIGIGDRSAVTRLVFSIKESRRWQALIHSPHRSELAIHFDGFGNIFGLLKGSDPKAPAVFAGSHLDTAVHGGKYEAQWAAPKADAVAANVEGRVAILASAGRTEAIVGV